MKFFTKKYSQNIDKNSYIYTIAKILNFHLFFFITISVFGNSLKAQHNQFGYQCGTVLSETQIAYMNATRQERNEIDLNLRRNAPVTIPMAVHRILDSANDVEAISSTEVSQIIAEANAIFQQADISFSYCFDEEIDNGDFNCLVNRSFHEYNMTDDYFLNGAINVYFIPELCLPPFISGTPPNAWASFPGQRYVENDRIRDWIVIQNKSNQTESNVSGNVLAHELGHYFNLYHTFQGPVNKPEEGQVIHDFELPARPLSQSGICGDDPMDTCNCGPNFGDELCSTPADPTSNIITTIIGGPSVTKFGEDCSDPSNCEFNPSFPDGSNLCEQYDSVNGDQYFPDPTNVMGYSHESCMTFFTDEQIDRMHRSLFYDRRYLSTDCTGCLDDYLVDNKIYDNSVLFTDIEVNNSILVTNLIGPVTVQSGANVKFDAGAYILFNPGFCAEYESTFLAVIDGCVGEFKIDESNSDLSNFSDVIKIQPNPFSTKTNIIYRVFDEDEVIISVFDFTGKKINKLVGSDWNEAGKHQVVFDGSNLPAGIYYCTIQAGNHIETQKMVLTK